MYSFVSEAHDELAEALGCHNLYALVERGRSCQHTVAFHAVLGSGYTHGIAEHTARTIALLRTYYVRGAQGRRSGAYDSRSASRASP